MDIVSRTHPTMPSSLLVRIVLVVVLARLSLQQTSQWTMPGGPGYQGFPGQGARYGFDIIDTPDRYGYVSNYPGGRTSFFLLGPNRGPGQQSWRGSNMGSSGTPQLGTYRPGNYRPGSFSPASYDGSGMETNKLGNNNGNWQQPGRF